VIVCFGARAENFIGSLHRGVRTIAGGGPRTRTWTTVEVQDRSVLEIVADETGPSLRWATTEVTRATAT
jgi:single-strand DNA-binding protein